VSLTHPKENLSDFAQGFGIPSSVVDGQDVVAVLEVLQPAIERARSGKGPTFLEIKTFRYRAHAEGHLDYSVECPEGLRPKHEVEKWKKRDPIILFRDSLLEKGILTNTDVKKIDKKTNEEMQEAEQFASESSYPNPDDMFKILYENNEHEEAHNERN
jgi:pyruvate dehydrogenase E1 component alpha subunit